MPNVPNREEAYALLTEFTQTDHLVKHALAVEAAMRSYASHFGEDENTWAVTGLLHDFDYDRYPSLEDHPFKGAAILEKRDVEPTLIRAIMSHADHTNTPRETRMEKALYAVDELCGFITAVALVRPSRQIADVAVKSVKKKLKDKAFARAVKREDIYRGCEDLGVELDDHIGRVIEAMRGISGDLGL